MSRGIGELAAAAYQTGGSVDPVLRLMTSASPGTFLDKAATLDAVARSQSGRLRLVKAARRELEHEQRIAGEQLAKADAIAASMERTRARSSASWSASRSWSAGWSPPTPAASASNARPPNAAPPRSPPPAPGPPRWPPPSAPAAPRWPAPRAPAPRPPSTYSGPASGRAAIAVQEAYRQLGKPYRWGAEGPDSFDCSGLSKWAWAKAGVSLPHYSRAQYNEGRHVSQGELQPGDLVFFGNPIHHLGIYVGNGNMIHAPQTGDVVKVSPAFRSDYTGAVRL